jgi:hypothetical protein
MRLKTECRRPCRQNHWRAWPRQQDDWRGHWLQDGLQVRDGVRVRHRLRRHRWAAHAFTAAEQLHFGGNDVDGVSSTPAWSVYLPVLQAALNVNGAAFFNVLASNLCQAVVKRARGATGCLQPFRQQVRSLRRLVVAMLMLATAWPEGR